MIWSDIDLGGFQKRKNTFSKVIKSYICKNIN